MPVMEKEGASDIPGMGTMDASPKKSLRKNLAFEMNMKQNERDGMKES